MAGGGVFKLLKAYKFPQLTDKQVLAAWGVTTAVWIVQPFDWVKKTFFEKAEPEN